MANRVGAAAGVNGDFFDIDSTQASIGGEIKGGTLIKSPTSAAGRTSASARPASASSST